MTYKVIVADGVAIGIVFGLVIAGIFMLLYHSLPGGTGLIICFALMA